MQKRLFTEINEKAKILELLGNHFRPKNVGEDVAPPPSYGLTPVLNIKILSLSMKIGMNDNN